MERNQQLMNRIHLLVSLIYKKGNLMVDVLFYFMSFGFRTRNSDTYHVLFNIFFSIYIVSVKF